MDVQWFTRATLVLIEEKPKAFVSDDDRHGKYYNMSLTGKLNYISEMLADKDKALAPVGSPGRKVPKRLTSARV